MEVTPKADKSVRSEYSPPLHSEESSPCEHKEEKHHQKLSSSLRERLKRSRRSFTSPFSVAKRLCVDEKEKEEEEEEENGQQVSADSWETPPIMPSGDADRNGEESGSQRLSGRIPEPTRPPPSRDFTQQRDRLRKEVKDKMETLRRLKMVKMYRSKNDLTQLKTLIDKWRSCAQAALYELQSDVPIEGRKASLSGLIDLFGLEDGILHFDRTEEDFTA
ncbi:swi5-dependent recombination DNA repair protein 1 homolog [Anoplopoma fimbria]|uniref:swi5-dependent recombination DNA repair protein 1 homolog n=1 Tax=Anoplopoma fimbria TaxID=229290 RepID=UPI0023EBD25F|nr:swi5-dependent recombination DNA repair protein 1 homolog [Anoplopoma fimbria]XP_054455759.1 swi5-dependent recombination DNA repair protein 1 homolog [Anoplopoma fimbria]